MRITTTRIAKPLAWTGSVVVAGCILAALVSGPGYQADLWHYRTGFAILRWSVYVCIGAAIVALAGSALAFARGERRTAAIGGAATLLGLALIVTSWNLQTTAGQVPRIHDITTDTQNPPQFVALAELRKATPNGPEYAGEKVAAEQRKAYPDIQPLLLPDPPARAFERALAAARAMGWDIVADSASDGRIEATDTTRWFRFKDDVVVRVAPNGTGSRVDVRSKSRMGRSDIGANARRIRAYLEKLTGR